MTSITIIPPASPHSKIISASRVTLNLPAAPKRFLHHGWHSWSLAAWTDLTPLPAQKPAILYPMRNDPLYEKEKLPHGSWFGAVEFEDGKVLLLGALGLETHVRLNGRQLEGRSEADSVEWLTAYGEEKSVFAEYVKLLGPRFGQIERKAAPRVWCSWYSLYSVIDEPLLSRVFDELRGLPFDVLQVDDGWQIKVGDWEANAKFPSGMAALAEKIKSTGRKAGLWLAPLIAVKSSRLFREHPDWFLKDARGGFVSASFNWGEELYALDTTHPAALDWLAALMRKARGWGFDYLKLDFLYAGALPGKRHADMPREAAYRQGLKAMREALGADAFLLLCAAPILPSLGLCDALRIGTDVSGGWESYRDAVLLANPTTPGTRNAIRTTLHRLWLGPLVHTDPDVVYFTSRENSLTREQKRVLQDLARVCNYKATSDLPQWLSPEERADLQAFLIESPEIAQIDRYIFRIGDRTVDFSPIVPLPAPAKGFDAALSALLGWLANHRWALRTFDWMNKNALDKMKRGL